MMNNSRLYIWRSVDGLSGEIPASSIINARQMLILRGVIPIKIKASIRLGKNCWQLAALSIITRQLATMLQAGLPLSNCLLLIAAEHPHPAWRYLLKELQMAISQGKSFSLALNEHTDAFPPLFRELIATGELTGKLDECCFLIAEQQDKLLKLQKKVRKALRYPLFILAVASIVTLLMLIFVLPSFAEIYRSFNAPLPWFTQSIISLSEAIIDYGIFIGSFPVLLYGYYIKKLKTQANWKEKEQKILLNLPLCGKLLQISALAKIFRTLAMTQHAGISLIAGIKSAANASGNIQFLNALTTTVKLIEQGTPLFKALHQQVLFPPLCYQLIRVGEESGMLDVMLDKLAGIYEAESESQAENLSSRLEPLLMLVLGIIVGGLVIAIYLPIFQLGNVMG